MSQSPPHLPLNAASGTMVLQEGTMVLQDYLKTFQAA
jgi:hypothetical protein